MHKENTRALIAAGRKDTSHVGTGRFDRPLASFNQREYVSETRMRQEALAEAKKPLSQRTFAKPADAEM